MSVKWKVGDKICHPCGEEFTVETHVAANQRGYELACWQLSNTSPPTTATERTLAPGWERLSMQEAVYGRCQSPSGACEDCAGSMGVFADTPAVASEPLIVKSLSDSCANKYVAVMPSKPASPARCATCTHVHVGPCNGTSPNGHFSCPCGHPKVAAKVEMRETFPLTRGHRMDMHDAEGMDRERAGLGRAGRATLLANLAREKPPGRRPIRTVARYEGNSDD